MYSPMGETEASHLRPTHSFSSPGAGAYTEWEWEEAVPEKPLQDLVEKRGRGMGTRGRKRNWRGHLRKRGCSTKSPCGGALSA